MKTETAVAALMVMPVETFALLVAVVMADSNGNGSRFRVSGCSGGNSGYGGGRQQQKLWGQATIKKCGSGSSGDSGPGSGDRGTAAPMAGRGRGAAEVTTMRAAAAVTILVVNLSP